MKGKLTFLVGFGAGYVLGARAGRDRYEQIAEKAQGVWRDPRVQDKAQQAQSIAMEKAGQVADVAKDKVKDTATDLASTAQEKIGSSGSGTGDTGTGWPDNDDSATTPAPTPGTATGPGTGTSGGTAS